MSERVGLSCIDDLKEFQKVVHCIMFPLKGFIDSLGSLMLGSGALAGVISKVGARVGGSGGLVSLSILTNAAYISCSRQLPRFL